MSNGFDVHFTFIIFTDLSGLQFKILLTMKDLHNITIN